MDSKKVKQWLACLIILGSSIFLGLYLYPLPPRPDSKPHEALGQVLAAHAAKLLSGGGRLIVIARDTDTFTMPAAELQWNSFRKALQKAGVSIAATRVVKVDPLRPVAVPPGDFFEILRKAADADVVVSFLGPPALTPNQITKLGAKRPRVVAVCTAALAPEVDLKTLFAAKLLQVAILNRKEPPPRPADNAPVSAWFDWMYQIATPENIGELAPRPDAAR